MRPMHPTPPPSRCRCSTSVAPASLAEKMLVVLRDGRKIVGTLRSFDQFANIVLEEAVERIIVGSKFADAPLGLYVIRGENVVLLGQVVRGRDVCGAGRGGMGSDGICVVECG